MFAFDHSDMEWMPINTVPFDRDVELAVIDAQGVHTLSFRCVRTIDGWINAMSQKKLYHVRALRIGGNGSSARDWRPSWNKRRDLSMEQLIREFGAWLKQGFGWLVDVIVFGCLWGISQISRLFSMQMGSAPILKMAVFVLVLLLILYAFYSVFGRFIGVIRWALDRIAYALGVILFSAVVVA